MGGFPIREPGAGEFEGFKGVERPVDAGDAVELPAVQPNSATMEVISAICVGVSWEDFGRIILGWGLKMKKPPHRGRLLGINSGDSV